MATATGTIISLDEFARLPDEPGKQELSDGELVIVPPVKFIHNKLSRRLFRALDASVTAAGVGDVWFEAGFQLGPRTVRQPDIAVTLGDRVAPDDGWLQGAPDIAIEVLSPGNSAEDIELKISQYLAAGAKLVWIVSPKARQVRVCRADGTQALLREPASVTGEPLLPGFTLLLADLFA
jgi:Uma2 family endonuclease